MKRICRRITRSLLLRNRQRRNHPRAMGKGPFRGLFPWHNLPGLKPGSYSKTDREACLPRFPAAVIELVFADLTTKGVAMDSQHHCGARLIALGAFEHPLDKPLFKFSHSFVKQD